MRPDTQAKLLRVLEHGEFLRVGGSKPISVDVRIIAATNRDLSLGIKDGTFRPDLYYRLNVVSVHLPPLRERRDDLVLLIRHFAQLKAKEMGIQEKILKPEAVDALLSYPWPGNVRELENLIERLLVLCESQTIGFQDLPEQVRRTEQDPGSIKDQVLQGRKSLGTAVDEFEREIITEALLKTDFNQTRAADLLGTTRRILKYRMDKLGIGGGLGSAPGLER
jgi:DNA-binding NtrC family response regulator